MAAFLLVHEALGSVVTLGLGSHLLLAGRKTDASDVLLYFPHVHRV